MFCREQVAQLRGAEEAVARHGARLVVVGNGQPFQAKAFAQERGAGLQLLVDPDLQAYAAAGLRRGIRALFDRDMPGDVWRAWTSGFRQGKIQGDPWQSGGVLLIEPPGVTRYAYVSRTAGDHAPVHEILAALSRLRTAC